MQQLDLKAFIERHRTVTILSHINPDADAIGTSLGIYALLKESGKQVEIANASVDLPKYLDFLPNFSKIKQKIDYRDSLIISCDCGGLDRLGFDLEGRSIINIDHHHTNDHYGEINCVEPHLSASAHVAYLAFKEDFTICKNAATCFYTALLSDTRYFTTNNVDEEVFEFARELILLGADHRGVAFNMIQRRSLASLRMLGSVLGTLRLHYDAAIASMVATREMFAASGARMSDIEGVVDYARSLATVEVGVLLVERENEIKVSLRSKRVDLSVVAQYFSGGGHKNACGFTLPLGDIEEILDKILEQIKINNCISI